MLEEKIPDRVEELILRYLGGEVTSDEISELEQWVKASPAHREAFLMYKKTWFITSLNKENKHIHIDHDWAILRKELAIDAEVKNIGSARKPSLRWLGLVASIAILIAACWWIFLRPSVLIQEVVAMDGIMDHTLDDGSVVSLNQGSILQFLTDMGKERKVVLDGDAFFNISRDPDRPFKISTQNLQIEVLGTSFYVDARDGQSKVQVIVQSGKVAFGKDQEKIFLEAGETGVYDKISGQMTQFKTNDPNYLSWKSHTLLFDETPLDQVVFAINRQYQSIVIMEDHALQGCTLTATYADLSLESIIKILEKTFNLQVDHQGEQIILRGDGCN